MNIHSHKVLEFLKPSLTGLFCIFNVCLDLLANGTIISSKLMF